MKFNWHTRLSVLSLFFLCVVVLLSSCSKKDVKMEEPLMSPSEAGSEGVQGLDQPAPTETAPVTTTEPAAELAVVYFDYDKYTIRSDARGSLRSNARWLKENGSVSVQIEGHCDERGTTEYNLALGERRAGAVRDYLTRLGISGSRLSTVSYGEERPSDSGHDESAWANNRRAIFVVVSR